MKLLLDTCAVIWAASQPESLSDLARQSLTDPSSDIAVSAMSCAEIACLVDRGRIQLSEHWKPWWQRCLDLNGWRCLDLDLAIIQEAYSLPDTFHSDPADRFVVATARIHQRQVITADRKILAYPHVEAVW